jgi:hypothetical protein
MNRQWDRERAACDALPVFPTTNLSREMITSQILLNGNAAVAVTVLIVIVIALDILVGEHRRRD